MFKSPEEEVDELYNGNVVNDIEFLSNNHHYKISDQDSGNDILLESKINNKSIIDGNTVEHLVSHFDGFYNEMISKVKTLRHVPIMKDQFKTEVSIDDPKLFKNLKNNPDVKKKLDIIKQLDDDIKDVIGNYKCEKEARLETQILMCNEIHKNCIPTERYTRSFLDLCQFENLDAANDAANEVESEDEPPNESNHVESHKVHIRRNKELAKEGLLANVSLTDEEKCKLEAILKIEEDYLKSNDLNNSQDVNEMEDDELMQYNTYKIGSGDSKRLEEIEEELEKYKSDESTRLTSSGSKNFEDTISEFLLQNELKKIDEKLDVLKRTEEDQMKELHTFLNNNCDNNENKGF